MLSALIYVIIFTNAGWSEGVAVSPGASQRDAPVVKLKSPKEIQQCLDALHRAKSAPDAPAEPYTFTKVAPEGLPSDCQDGDLKVFKEALRNQINNCKKPGQTKFAGPMRLGCKMVSREQWCLQTNEKMLKLANAAKDDFKKFMDSAKTEFDWYKSKGRLEDDTKKTFKKGDFQFTGYFAPGAVEAHEKRSDEFAFPIYSKPDDLIVFDDEDPRSCGVDPYTGDKIKTCQKLADGKFGLYPDRAQIGTKILLGKGLELAWVRSPLVAFNFQVEGDGELRITKEDGTKEDVHLNYATDNGRPSNMLGSIIPCAGGDISDTSVSKFLSDNPTHAIELMNYNQAFVFFKRGKSPLGVENIPLSDRHSLATDQRLIRTGSVVLFNVDRPEGKVKGCKKITSLAISQDIGKKIKLAHGDWYQGQGERAGRLADNVNNPGSIFIAVPIGAGEISSDCASR